MLALDSMRLEKNYRSWKSDLTSDYTMLQSGLEKWIKFDKGNFIGKEALKNEFDLGTSKKFVTLVVDDPEDNKPFGEPVYLSPVFAGDDAADARFWPISTLLSGEVEFAGDHLTILKNWLSQ